MHLSSIHFTSGHDIGESELDLTSAAGGRDGGHVGEVLVLERRPGRDPVVGVVGQQAGQQLVPAQPEVRGQNLRGAIEVEGVVSLLFQSGGLTWWVLVGASHLGNTAL